MIFVGEMRINLFCFVFYLFAHHIVSKLNRIIKSFFEEMIKQESKDQYQEESIYRHLDKTITVSKKGKIFVFKVHDEVNGEWYQSQQVELERINEKTIEAAFDPKVHAVTYQLLKPSQTSATFRFIIKIKHISTQFTQDIQLPRIDMNKQLQMKLHYDELKRELINAQKMLINQLNSQKDELILQPGNFDSITGAKYQFQVKKGKYILKITGYYISHASFNGDYDNQYYDDNENIIMQAAGGANCPSIIVSIYVDDHLLEELTSTSPNFIDGYQYHFNVSTILELNKQKKVKLQFKLKNQDVFNLNQCLISVIPFNQYHR